MALSPEFLDEIRARTSLSALISQTLPLKKVGREQEACCPFHNEKTPSFRVNDDKGFYHCFGCGVHGDAIRWLTDKQGLPFMDAVRTLADAAGLEMPARSPEESARQARATDLYEVLAKAQRHFAQALEGAGAVREYLAARGVGDDLIARFGLGYAHVPYGRSYDGELAGLARQDMIDAGLVHMVEGKPMPQPWFYNRLMIPIKDARSRVIGFAGRVLDDSKPKYVNSPAGPLFDKSRILFNLDRAAPAARQKNRMIIVEGQVDTVVMDGGGFPETVAPMGTAITEHHLQRAWRVHHRPIVLMDGDEAGLKALTRVCKVALPMVGWGRELLLAQCPWGEDPDSMLRNFGADTLEIILAGAQPLDAYLFEAVVREAKAA